MDQRFVRTTCPASGLSLLCGGQGAPVVLVHGLGWDGARLWVGQAGVLADAGYRVIVPDLRGTGASPPLRARVGISDLARDLVLLLQAQRATAPALVGFSMGAMVAVEVAALWPARLLVQACGGLNATVEGAAAVEAMLARATTLGPRAFALEQSGAIFGPAFRAAHPGQVADFVEWRAAMDQQSLHHAFRAPFGQDLRDKARALGCPIYMIAADHDQFLPLDDIAALATEIGASGLTVIAQSGHMAPVEQPVAFATALMATLEAA